MKKIKTLIVTMILIIAMATPAKALIPLVYFGYSLAIHVGVVAGLIWWNTKRTGNSSANTTTGNVVTPGETVWVDLSGDQPVVHNDNVKVRIDHNDLKSKVNANPTKYPKLKNALTEPAGTTTPWDKYHWEVPEIGRYVEATGLTGTVTSTSVGNEEVGWGGWIEPYQPPTVTSNTIQYYIPINPPPAIYTNTQITVKLVTLTIDTAGTPSGTKEATPTQFANKINAQPDTYTGEVDDWIKSNPNVIHFDDPASDGGNSGAGTYSTPTPPTEQQIANHGGNTTVNDGKPIQQQISSATNGTSSGYLPSVKPTYDTNFGDAPTKKDIKTLIGDFLATSPLFQVLENTKINLSGETSTISMPTYKGAYKTIDFSKYEAQLDLAGTIMLSLIHILAIIILFAK